MTNCAICQKEFTKQRMGQVVCSPKCAIKVPKVTRQKEKALVTKRKEALKTKSEVAKEVQILCNRYVRKRDLQACHGCISCGTQSSPRWDAGHFRSVGSAPHIRFDYERNIHLQCAKCNTFLAGNLLAYRENLPYRIGLPQFIALQSDNEAKHYSISDLQDLKQAFKEKLKQLKGGLA